MKSLQFSSTFFLLSVFLIDLTTASCAHGTYLHKRKLNYKRAEASSSSNETVKTVEVGKFGYIGNIGPTNWASLSPDNIACSTSTQQSPIDVTNTSTTLVAAGEVKITIPDIQEAEFENLGTTVEVVMEGKGGKTVIPGGKEFELKQFHFHSPSEHTIEGEYFPLEMHMVHQSAEDSTLAVVSVLFSLSAQANAPSTPLLLELTPSLSAIFTPGSITTTAPLKFTELISSISSQALHTYNGSLTTPPCKEGLEFFITSQPLELDVLSFNTFKAVLGFNSRFTQNTVGQANLLAASAATTTTGEMVVANGTVKEGVAGEEKAVVGEEKVVEGAVKGNKTVTVGGEKVTVSGAAGTRVITVDGSEGKAKLHETVKGLTGIDLGTLGL
ncbi:carbonic anhydrase [Acephala macrosclerotiorum]|nr:carbonic anhydrase [Acephala macrosclerotiorum]